MKHEDAPQETALEEQTAKPSEPLREDEFYWDGPYMVFTAAYHLRRGSCCHSGCRHCPYGEADLS